MSEISNPTTGVSARASGAGRSIRAVALCSTALIGLGFAPSAFAQEPAAEEVVVTGSRVITNGFNQPTPVTVLTMEQMQATAPNSLSDAINQMPQFRASFTSATTAFAPIGSGNAGAAFINLRGLQPRRGLILLNGERVVASQAQNGNAIDLNTLPQSLVRRVDVVTGGASAAYGSDALSGVVNFVLDTRFTGIKGEVRGGRAHAGDNESVNGSLAVGRPFAGGRGHVVASIEYYRTAGIKNYLSGDRDWATAAIATFANPACPQPQRSTTCPTRIVTGPLFPNTMSSGGLIQTGATALRGLTFVGSGSSVATQPFPFGSPQTTTQMVGGGIDPPLGNYYNYIPVNLRWSGYFRAEYEIAPDWTIHADALYGWSASKFFGQLSYNQGPNNATGGFLLFSDNPFLPASVRAQMGGPGATSAALYNPATGLFNGPTLNTILVGRFNTDIPVQQNFSNYSTTRFSGGINGKVNFLNKDWNVSAYYTHGRGMHTSSTLGLVYLPNFYNAVDAVASPGGAGLPAAGTPMCRSTITNRGDGCVPYNVVGQRNATPEALRYIMNGNGNSHTSQVQKQNVVDLTIRGEPFSTWAGPVAMGFGATYRKETLVMTADALSNGYLPAVVGSSQFKPGLTAPLTINGFPGAPNSSPRGNRGMWSSVNNGGAPPGSLDVKEAFIETLVPLLRDHSFAKTLDVNLAFRHAEYQYGGGVNNYKIGVNYRPFDDLRIRTTRSHDVRAPGLGDLFAGTSVAVAGVSDPFRLGTTGTPEAGGGGNTISSGNPNVKPEIGDTFTLGAVYTPSYIPGFNISVDYYQIIISKQINILGAGTIVNQCFQGNAELCTLISRNNDPTSFGPGNTIGPITSVFAPVLNSGTQKLGGLDIEASYNLPLNRIWEGRNDAITFRTVMNYQGKNQVSIIGSTSITSTVGVIGSGVTQGTGGGQDWSGSFNINYRNGPLTVNWQQRFINSGRINNNVDDEGNPYPANILVNPNTTQSGQVPNTVPAYWYSDLSINYKFGPNTRYEAFLTINNLFDKDPPTFGSLLGQGVLPINYGVYDGVGRQYTAGVRFRF